jgi:hypothetical protein
MGLPQLGEFDWEDPRAVDDWIEAHRRRHRAYIVAAGTAASHAVNLPESNLQGPMNTDWFRRNLLAHKVLATLAYKPVLGSTLELDVTGLKDPRVFQQWIRAHNLAHWRADQVFGLP